MFRHGAALISRTWSVWPNTVSLVAAIGALNLTIAASAGHTVAIATIEFAVLARIIIAVTPTGHHTALRWGVFDSDSAI